MDKPEGHYWGNWLVFDKEGELEIYDNSGVRYVMGGGEIGMYRGRIVKFDSGHMKIVPKPPDFCKKSKHVL